MPVGGQPGNQNAAKGKPWAEAINRALARRELTGKGDDLNKLAEALLDKAAEGDMAALKELGDRLDGKAVQQINANVTGSLTSILESLPPVAAGKNPPVA